MNVHVLLGNFIALFKVGHHDIKFLLYVLSTFGVVLKLALSFVSVL